MRRKIVGVTVGTPISPQTIKKKLNPVTSVNGIEADENGNVKLEIAAGGGLSKEAAALLLSILSEALFANDQFENILKLKEALGIGVEEEPDVPDKPDVPEEPDEPDIPDEPDVPVIQKLTAPEIYLEIDGEPVIPDEPDVSDRNTPAILGIAILGKTVLGNYVSGLPKLDTPVICLASAQKLDAPVIRLENDTEPDEPDDPEEPDEPEIPKLDAPNIRLHIVSSGMIPGGGDPPMGDVTTNKLAAPVIYLETVNEPEVPDEPEEPDEPEIPDEPDEPDIPAVPKLEAPVIYVDCDHTYHIIAPIKDPTCVTPGTSRCICMNCAHSWDISTPANGVHDYRTLITKPTCTEQGYTTHTCRYCDESYVDSYVDATGHSWNDGVVTKEPTEQETGVLTYTCTKCGDTRTEVIPVLDHVHSYVATVTNPTCTEQGYTTHTCTCGDSYKDSYVDALGHDWSEPYYSDEFATGYGRKCNRCGELDAMMQKLNAPVIRLVDMKLKTPVIDIHDYSSTVVEPTCTEQGYTLHSCACGDSYTDTFVDALGHDWGEVYKSGDEYVRDCARCGEQETGAEQYLRGEISIEAVASGDTSFLSDTKPYLTFTRFDGRKGTIPLTATYPTSKLIDLPLGEYTFAAIAGRGWIDGYELTVKYTVQYGKSDPVETQTIVLTPEERNPILKVIYHYEKNDGEHVHSYVDTVTDPTCTARGYTTHTCMCGYKYDDNYVNALGHDWGEPHYDGDVYVRECNRCGARRSGSDEDVKGNLTMRVVVDGDRSIEDQGEYRVKMTKPDGYAQTAIVTPSLTESRLINLQLGDYHFEALPEYSSVDGYNLTIKYSVDYVTRDPIETQTATLTPDVTYVVVTVTYHYEKIPTE